MKRKQITFLLLIILIPSACAPQTAQTDLQPTLPNPATQYCLDEGYESEIRSEEDGEVGYCIFPDGSECEEWAFIRGECTYDPPEESAGETAEQESADETQDSDADEEAAENDEHTQDSDADHAQDSGLSLLLDPDFGLWPNNSAVIGQQLPLRASSMPDLSGLAWVEEDLFLAVHDAKYPEEVALPRVSLLQLPRGLDGIRWQPLDVTFAGPKSNDFESVAGIPNSRQILLVESTEEQDEKPFSRRIFLANLDDQGLQIIDTVEWPVETKNVEGTAVAQSGSDYIFIYAERAQGEGSTTIHFAPLQLEPLQIGEFTDAGSFTSPSPTGDDTRPVTGIDVDSAGLIYVASAEDPGDDNGPFRSAVYAIGRVESQDNAPAVTLFNNPVLMARLDGLKVESLAVRELPAVEMELFVGFDDENYGGLLRPIPLN